MGRRQVNPPHPGRPAQEVDRHAREGRQHAHQDNQQRNLLAAGGGSGSGSSTAARYKDQPTTGHFGGVYASCS